MRLSYLIAAIASPVPVMAQSLPRNEQPAPSGQQTPLPVLRANENAVTQAEDAFGVSIGREELGLYSSSDIRGFSPIDAGNARIDGIYFDQFLRPITRIRQSTTIRVGLASQGFVFPAPTGVVDYALRKPGNEAGASVLVDADHWGSVSAEVDAVVPLTRDKLSLGFGAFIAQTEFYNATNAYSDNQGIVLRWTPTPDIALTPFWSRSYVRDDDAGQIYVPGGDYLPPRIPRRRFNGPDWAAYTGTGGLYGGTANFRVGPQTTIVAGLFHSYFSDDRSAVNLALDLQPDGRFNHLVLIDPPSRFASDSGEVRIAQGIVDGDRLHGIYATIRYRNRFQRYDGSASVDLGPRDLRERVFIPEPPLTFRRQSRDRIEQWTGGLAYDLRWRGLGELSIGVQKTDYRKQVDRSDTGSRLTQSNPWLFYATAAGQISETLVIYGSFSQGLEESGLAPSNAVNRGEPVPAIRTRQFDGGVRWMLTPGLKLIAGGFDLEKPYFNIDANNRFTALGTIRNQGVELSLNGALTPRLDLVAGGVFLRPRVTGAAVDQGIVGDRPVGFAARNLTINLDWRPTANPGVSFDIRVTHRSRVTATTNNAVSIPSQTLVDLGGRIPVNLGSAKGSLRLSVSNIFDVEGFDLRGAGAYDMIAGRLAQLRFTIDI
ncbi:TonB-dependent receptor [Rhizorhabdus sp. FW153]|uniref:TonB-dependent receptor n=1 Tax=Rhizorhabdus sp. FW153 TaxID=3400216 RepID=UPI003CECFA46